MDCKDELHPLFNPIILSKIFSFLKINALKNCRLVCKSWNLTALPFLQKESVVFLARGGKADRESYSFQNFIELILNIPSENIPFRNYYLDHWALNEKREKNMKLFWDICGHSIKTLHIANTIFYEVSTIRNILYYWSPNVESLKIEDCLFYTITNENAFEQHQQKLQPEDFDELTLNIDYYDHVSVEKLKDLPRDREISFVNDNLVELSYDQIDDEEFPLAWEEIFHTFPKLQILKISMTTDSNQISKILNELDTVRREVHTLGNISELQFFQSRKHNQKLYLRDSHLNKISDIMCLPLKHLTLTVNEAIEIGSIVNILRQYGPILEYLYLYSEDEHKVYEALGELFKYQKFPHLLKLNICMNIPASFHFMEEAINLKELSIWQKEEDFSWETPIDDLITKSSSVKINKSRITKLSIGYNVVASRSMELLCTWFPNITVLKIALTDETIRVVYRELKSLQEIMVYDNHLTDAGITGNPIALCQSSAWNVKNQREHLYIGDLKKLWRFTLTFRRYDYITDLSVYQGFLDSPELSCLSLTRTKIGQRAFLDLSMKPSIITLITPTIQKGGYAECSS